MSRFQVAQIRIVVRQKEARYILEKLQQHAYIGHYGVNVDGVLMAPTKQEENSAILMADVNEKTFEVGTEVIVSDASEFVDWRHAPLPINGTKGKVARIEKDSALPFVVAFTESFVADDGCKYFASKEEPLNIWFAPSELSRDPAVTCLGEGI